MSAQLVDTLLNGGYHVGLIVGMVILWRRVNKLDRALAECLQSGGKLSPAALDAIDDV